MIKKTKTQKATCKINLQIASHDNAIPSKQAFKKWVNAIITTNNNCELNIRIVDITDSAQLNRVYRNNNAPTNILSFPFTIPNGVTTNILGDLVICAPLVKEEAILQDKKLSAHWAHLTIHGVLHLLGYTHKSKSDAAVMEAKEIATLRKLGFEDPYN
jgi:probable rRNA maturation factor